MISRLAAFFVILLIAVPLARAQPATTAASPPPPPAKKVVIPPGFKLVVEGGRNAICQEGDEPWVRQALTRPLSTTNPARPTTMPANLLEKLTEQRDFLVERLAADLALEKPEEVRKLVDEDLVPLLRQATGFRAPVFFLVTTEDSLREIVRNGWTDPSGRMRYNRAAEKVSLDLTLQLQITADADDQVLPIIYESKNDLRTRREKFEQKVDEAEIILERSISERTMYGVQLTLVGFISRTSIEPLKLGRDQQWFGVGMAGVLSAKYLALINGSPEDQFLGAMSSDDPRNPIRMDTINLLSPTPMEELREAARFAYADALRRKSTRVMRSWLDRAGPAALPKVIRALRQGTPVDGPGLVKLIADQTGVDLTSELLPK